MERAVEKESSSSDRAYFRVRVDIPLRITPIEDSELEKHTTEVLSLVDLPTPEMDLALVGWLDRIERKLDRLLAQQGLLDLDGTVLDRRESIDLSAAGFRFESTEPAEPGSAVLVELELPEVPVRLIRCVGRVTASRTLSDSSRHAISIAFETIRQSDRDAVVRYTLVVQREAIRGRGPERGHSG